MARKFLTPSDIEERLSEVAVVLDIGCGGRKLKLERVKVLGIDYRGAQDVDYVCYLAREALPFKDDSVDCIYSDHFIEHLNYEQKVHVLFEVRRVLRPGGTFLFNVSHFTFFYITAFEHQGTNFGHATVWALENAESYSKDIPFFQTKSVALRARIGRKSIIDKLLNWSFRFSERYLHLLCGGIDEIQFVLEKPANEVAI